VSSKDLLRVRGRLQQEEQYRGINRGWLAGKRAKSPKTAGLDTASAK
jgi:hypothetical protein